MNRGKRGSSSINMVLGLLCAWFEMQMYFSNFLTTAFADHLCEPVAQYLVSHC